MGAPQIDLSFSRYVAARKGVASARHREGAAYAYAGDTRVRATLGKLKPVTLAVEAAVRFWQSVEKSRMLGTAVQVTDRQFPALRALVVDCAQTLRIPVPALYVSPDIGSLDAHTFGTADDACIMLNAAVVDHLTEAELRHVIGHECGHIHNDHVVYTTTLHLLDRSANQFVRWVVKPAAFALKAWARRADITCDRAGLMCTRDLAVSTAAMVKLALGARKLYATIDIDEYLRQREGASAGPGRFDELFRSHPYLPKRVQALRLFAETAYWKSLAAGTGASQAGADGVTSAGALTIDECDARVAALLKVVGR